MKRTTKGALAAGGAAALLLGGAGTLAYWTDTAEVPGATINAGHLDLTDEDCGAGWVLDGGAAFGSQLLVPGDELTKTCTYTLDIAGEHFTKADFTVTAPTDVTGAQALVEEIGVATTVELDGTPQATATGVTVADDDVITVEMKIEWPYGTAVDNDSNVAAGLSASLDALTLVVKQNHG
jgi:alternate signal-mediated exported protein